MRSLDGWGVCRREVRRAFEHGDDQGVAEVAHVDGLNAEVGEDAEQGPPPFTDTVVAAAAGKDDGGER
jgi:hypothetical protein